MSTGHNNGDDLGLMEFSQENLPYFYSHLDRLFELDYFPTENDILRVRSKTTGISETRFDLSDMVVRLFDVGGQR